MNTIQEEYGLILTKLSPKDKDRIFKKYDEDDDFWIITSMEHSISYLNLAIETSAWINKDDQMDKWVVSFGDVEDSEFILPSPPTEIENVIAELNCKIPGCCPVWGHFKIER